jgi:hypothetical protein
VNFTYASRTLFIANVSLPHEQSVVGALFQAITQIGSAIGLSVSTIVSNSVLRVQSRRLDVSVDQGGDNAPMAAQLKAYQAAMWTGFSFEVLCKFFEAFRCHLGLWYGLSSHVFFSGTVLCVFLRGVALSGRHRQKKDHQRTATRLDEEGNVLESKAESK